MIGTILEELKMDCRLCRFDRGYKRGMDYGIVVFHDSEVVCIKKYDRDGHYDGIMIFWVQDIETMMWNGNDLGARMKFITTKGLNLDEIRIDVTSFNAFMDSASEVHGYVTVHDERSDVCFIGPLLARDDNYVHMINFGNPSRMDRTTTLIARSRVTSVEVDCIYQRNLIDLHQGR